jgi:hypothetical protein
LLLALPLFLAAPSARAQTPDGDVFDFFAVAAPQGTPTAAELRLHHPLYLVDLCRQVKAGTHDRQEVAALVGGDAVLDALLAMDLDAVLEQYSTPRGVPAAAGSAWQQILTKGGAAPPPPVALPDSVRFAEVHPLDAPVQVVQLVAPMDGEVQASLPANSPFRILSMRAKGTNVVETRSLPSVFGLARPRVATGVPPTFARSQPPWRVPVRAGQDVDVEIGLPAGAVLPTDGVADRLTLGDPTREVWKQDLPVYAQPALTPDPLYVSVSFPPTGFAVVQPAPYVYGIKQPFQVPLTVANPYPPDTVYGTIHLASGPQGLTMQDRSFVLQPGGQLTIPLTLWVDSTQPAWFQTYVPQPFRIQVKYHNANFSLVGSTTPNYGSFVMYPGSKSWWASGYGGPIRCEESLLLYASGSLTFSGSCTNDNLLPFGKAIGQFYLGSAYVGGVGFYGIGAYATQFHSYTIHSSTYQTNFLFWRAQPFLPKWTGCTLCSGP